MSRADRRSTRNQRLRNAEGDRDENLRSRLNVCDHGIRRRNGKLADRTLFSIVMIMAGGTMRLVQHRHQQHANYEYQSQESGDALFHCHGNLNM